MPTPEATRLGTEQFELLRARYDIHVRCLLSALMYEYMKKPDRIRISADRIRPDGPVRPKWPKPDRIPQPWSRTRVHMSGQWG